MAESKELHILKLKYGFALKNLIADNKDFNGLDKLENQKEDSYSKLYNVTGVTGTTISNIIRAKSETKIGTLHKLLEALGKTLIEFAEIIENITNKELAEYEISLAKSRKPNRSPKQRKKK